MRGRDFGSARSARTQFELGFSSLNPSSENAGGKPNQMIPIRADALGLLPSTRIIEALRVASNMLDFAGALFRLR